MSRRFWANGNDLGCRNGGLDGGIVACPVGAGPSRGGGAAGGWQRRAMLAGGDGMGFGTLRWRAAYWCAGAGVPRNAPAGLDIFMGGKGCGRPLDRCRGVGNLQSIHWTGAGATEGGPGHRRRPWSGGQFAPAGGRARLAVSGAAGSVCIFYRIRRRDDCRHGGFFVAVRGGAAAVLPGRDGPLLVCGGGNWWLLAGPMKVLLFDHTGCCCDLAGGERSQSGEFFKLFAGGTLMARQLQALAASVVPLAKQTN